MHVKSPLSRSATTGAPFLSRIPEPSFRAEYKHVFYPFIQKHETALEDAEHHSAAGIPPLLLVGNIVGYNAADLARSGINQASRDDLEHMATFTRHLLEAHHQQFQVYQQERKNDFIRELETLLDVAREMVEEKQRLQQDGKLTRAQARDQARKLLKQISIGASGYIYTLSSDGVLQAHIAREGEDISDEKDGDGRLFIQEMIDSAREGTPNTIHQIRYPWRNEALGDTEYRDKIAVYTYFPEWDWIIAAAGYIEESYADAAYEKRL